MLYKKLFVFIFALLTAASCAPTKTMQIVKPTSPALLGKAATVAFIAMPKDKVAFAYCSGVWINKDTLLTALHCARAAARMQEVLKLPPEFKVLAPLLVPEVKDPTGYSMSYVTENEVTGFDTLPKASHKSTIIAIDTLHDLAIVRALYNNIPDHIWLPVANDNPSVGDKVYVVGHPGGLYFTFFDGMVSAIRESKYDIFPHREEGEDEDEDDFNVEGPFVQVFSGIWHGNSGGPIISEKGEIVGIVSFGTDTPSQGFCITPPSIKRFIIETYHKNLL